MENNTLTNAPLALIIEDDKKQATIFSQALRMADYETEVIRDGQTALERLAETIPAMVVLDLHLPHYSGKDILRTIRSDARLEKTRVILATADALLAKSISEDADLVLLKPISFNQLRDLAKRFNFHRSHQASG
ncbi:MAG: response regulator [Anaerolineae bacterium]|nr:response regulator [Anaerolineae bacterium]MCB9105010.1 response regulator [Anaerolineales bacterium]